MERALAAGRVFPSGALELLAGVGSGLGVGLAQGLLLPGPTGALAAVLGTAGVIHLCVSRRSVRRGFLVGLMFGTAAYALAFRGFLLLMGPLGLLALAVTAVLVAVWASLISLLPVGVGLAAAPLAWVALEAVRGWLLAGTHWAPIALSQVDLEWARRLAALAGREGVALAVVGLGSGAAAVMARRWIPAALLFSGCLLLIGSAWAAYSPPDGRILRVAAVQTWNDNYTKWFPPNLPRILREVEDLSAKAARSGAGLVVWPETAVPADPFARADARGAIIRSAEKAPVLAGALVGPPQLGPAGRFAAEPFSTPRPINVLLHVDRSGALVGRYAKSVAFPFGEMGMVKGPGFIPMGSPWGKVGAVICWENSMPHAAFRYAESGVSLAVAPANLAWFGSVVDAQYLLHSRLLAAELRVPVIQSLNRGRSAVIDASGKVAAFGPARGAGIAVADVAVPRSPSRGPVVGWCLRVLSVVASLALGAYGAVMFEPVRGEAVSPRRARSLLGSLAVVAALSTLFLAAYAVAGFPLGRPSLPLALLLLAGGLLVGYLAFGPLWAFLAGRFGNWPAALAAAAALMLAARILLPVEAAGWMFFQIIPLVLVRRWSGDEYGPTLALGVATAMTPVWVAVI